MKLFSIISRLMTLGALAAACSACPVVRATGDSVEAVGQGTGHALAETGRGLGHAVAGTGDAISDAAR